MDWKAKVFSRKFLISLAAFLGSLGTGIVGLATGNETVAVVGGVLSVVSAALYAFAEAYVDAASVASRTTNTTISAATTAKDVVEKAMGGTDGQ